MTAAVAASVICQIRPMRVEDIPQVAALDQASFSLPWPESAYRYEIKENPHSVPLVAERPDGSGTIIGLLVLWLIIDEAHIATIAVRAEERQQGLGATMLAEALKIAISKGMASATLEVRAGNLAAQRLYRRFQFEEISRRPRYYRDNQEDALIMTIHDLGPAYLDWLNRGEWLSTSSQG